jgi:hypothetical protein
VQALFEDGSIRDRLHQHLTQLEEAVQALPAADIATADVESLSKQLAAAYQIKAPSLVETQITQRQTDTKVTIARNSPDAFEYGEGAVVPAIRLEIIVPFTGEKELLRLSPGSQIPLRRVEGRVLGDAIVYSHTYLISRAEQVPNEVHSWLGRLKEKIQVIATEIAAHNSQLERVAHTLITKRRQSLGASSAVAKGLGFPLYKREGTPEVYAVPLERKPLQLASVGAPTTPSKKWVVSDKDYEEILEVFSAMSLSMERMPTAFAHLGEEEIRAFFLAYLNARYRGTATGETFNAAGKTDILIQVEGRTAFIAECKIWKGGEAFTNALDQLLSYLTWRDTRTALVIFNRNKNLGGVLKQIPGLVRSHSAFAGGPGQIGDTKFRYLLSHPTDADRTLLTTVLVFDVPGEAGADVRS